MNTRCQDVVERVVEAITGSVPPAERVGIAEHLAVCERCRAEAEALEATAAVVRHGPEVGPPPGFWADFNARLHTRCVEDRQPFGVRVRRWLTAPRHAWGALALTTAMAVAISVAVRTGPTGRASDPAATAARELVTQTMTTTLPSLGDLLETWGAGLSPDSESPDRAPR